VATPVAWEEVDRKLDPAKFTLRTVPQRLARVRDDPWQGMEALRQRLPDLARQPREAPRAAPTKGRSAIVSAARPKRGR
jgi:bifunctional non-homologous end joining protein LigD